MLLGVDLSSILWTCLRQGKDSKGIEVEFAGKTFWINRAIHGYEGAVQSIVSAMKTARATPEKVILVEEGLNSKRRRLMIDSSYKANREEKPQEENLEFQKLRSMITELFRDLGSIVVSQEGVEGDDVLGWLARNTEEPMMIHTFDGDLMVLHTDCNPYGAPVEVRIRGEVGVNKYGPFDHKLIAVYKATVGDTSDGIKGCPGFGKVAFQDLYTKYGEEGLFELLDMLEAGSLKPLYALHGQCKLVTKLLDNEPSVITSYRLAKIHDEWVNTVDSSLVWKPGMVKNTCQDERLSMFRQKRRLVTNANLVDSYNILKSKLAETEYFAFDLETSPCDESEDWMAAQGNPNGVDVLGHKLTGFSLTFGANHNYTMYFSVDHKDTDNIAVEDARMVLELATSTGKPLVIQNTQFEATICATTVDSGLTWQEHWKNNGYHGFLPNWLDTVFEASYVDENLRTGLKERAKIHLGYEQATFMDTVCKVGVLSEHAQLAQLERDQTQHELTVAKLHKEWEEAQDPTAGPEVPSAPPQYPPEPQPYPVLPSGGRVIHVATHLTRGNGDGTETETPLLVTKQYRMNELTAEEVFDYGTDDTIVTCALHNFYKLVMQLEHTWQVYLDVEIAASYQHAKNFLDGKSFSLEAMSAQVKEDNATYDKAWAVLREYLIEKGWEGTVLPSYSPDIDAKGIKAAYRIFYDIVEEDEGDEDDDLEAPKTTSTETKDPVLSSRVRTPAKLAALVESFRGQDLFTESLKACIAGFEGAAGFTNLIRSRFSGEPVFKLSNKQMTHLLYEVMQLPVRLFNKPTAKMRKEGVKQGKPMANALAIKYAIVDGDERQRSVLEAIQLIQMVKTRRGLYYEPYPKFIHWKTGKIHSTHRQCATNTRRASSAAPNEQQMPKHPKIEGQVSKFRQCVIPHKRDAVIVSLDFSQQELRVIADYSRDPNMVACYVGDDLKDMHILTALGIVKRQKPELGWSYATFVEQLGNKEATYFKYAKEMRGKGKTTNFATEFGAMAPKIAQTMMVTEDEAQQYIDAKEEAFPEVLIWKEKVVEEAKETGVVRTKLGAVRHLAKLLNSDDRWESSKAERQAVNFKVQGSSAEMTKLAEGRMWKAGLSYKYDAICYGPVHDEVVWSVLEAELPSFLRECHACMVAPYADMWIPIESSISFGPNFGEQIEIGTQPTDAAISAGLKELAEMRKKV